MGDSTVPAHGKVALVVSALIAVAGMIWSYYDAITLALLVSAAGLIHRKMDRRSLAVCALLASSGLLWSSRGFQTVSWWWRGRIVCDRLVGRLPHLSWREVPRAVSRSYYSPTRPHPKIAASVQYVSSQPLNGRQCELLRTSLGDFWAPAPARSLLTFLLWEMTVQMDYESRDVGIRHGDTVVDCGAHVGVFTRYALMLGAERVIAIEPDPTNDACLEANFSREVSEGRVILVKAGVWEKETRLTLTEPRGENSGTPTFLAEKDEGTSIPDVLALPLDDIVAQLRLSRVDFIKMDIEGSERFALRGAGSTLRRFKPRMAISAYHMPDDPAVIPEISRGFVPDYRVSAKDVEFIGGRITPKVLFFDASPVIPD